MNLAEIKEGYEAGLSLSFLGKLYGVSPNTIRNRLLEMGVTLRKQGCPQNRKPIPIDKVEAKRLYAEGWTYKRIAMKFGVDPKTIRNRLVLEVEP